MLESLEIGGTPVDDARHYTLGLIGYHADNCMKNLGIMMDETDRPQGHKNGGNFRLHVLEEYLRAHSNLTSRTEGRLVFSEP